MTRHPLSALLLLLSACARVGSSRSEANDRTSEAGRVMALEQSYWTAEQRHDSVAVDRLLAPDYVSMSSRGRSDRTKREELALLFGGRVRLERFAFSGMRAAWVSPDVGRCTTLSISGLRSMDGRSAHTPAR